MSNSAAAVLTNHTPEVYNKNASFVYSDKYTNAVYGLLDPQPGERIVDLGCGTGEVTMKIRQAVGDEGFVLGLDSSESMLAKARINSYDQVTLNQIDIQDIPSTLPESYQGTFDAVFTTAVLHWTKRDPKGVLEGVKWLLKPGGRFIFEFGGFGNVVGVRSAIHQVIRKREIDPYTVDPFYYPTDRAYSKLISSTGLIPSDNIALYPRPTPLPGDLKGWLDTFVRNTFLADFERDEQEKMMDEIQEICKVDGYWKDDETREEGWEIMYVRLRGSATKPI